MAKTDLTFFWRCEGTTLDGTHDHSDGDTTADAGATNAVINTDTVRVGTNSADMIDTSGNFRFTASSIYTRDGSMGFWFYAESWTNQSILSVFRDTGAFNDYVGVRITGTSGSGNVELVTSSLAVGSGSIATTGANLSSGNWYFLEARWSFTNGDIKISVYNTSLVEQGTAGEDLAYTAGNIPATTEVDDFEALYGNGNDIVHIDNLMVSSIYDEDFVSNATVTSYTAYDGTVAPLAVHHIKQMAGQ